MWHHDTNDAAEVCEKASQTQNVMIISTQLQRRPLMLIL
jgi:hypothetical protein